MKGYFPDQLIGASLKQRALLALTASALHFPDQLIGASLKRRIREDTIGS